MADTGGKNKRRSSELFERPIVAPLSYRVRRKLEKLERKYQHDEGGNGIRKLVDDIESFCEAEIDAGRIADSPQFWVAIYSYALTSVKAKINSLIGKLALSLTITGGGRPGEQASAAELQRDLSRLVAEIQRKLASASAHIEPAKSAETGLSLKLSGILRFVRRGKYLVAEHRSDMESAIAETYEHFLPDMASARSIVRTQDGKITVTELQGYFKNTAFAKALDDEDWQTLIKEFSQKRPAGLRNLTVALLARRTGFSNLTVATYTKPSRKRKKAVHQ